MRRQWYILARSTTTAPQTDFSSTITSNHWAQGYQLYQHNFLPAMAVNPRSAPTDFPPPVLAAGPTVPTRAPTTQLSSAIQSHMHPAGATGGSSQLLLSDPSAAVMLYTAIAAGSQWWRSSTRQRMCPLRTRDRCRESTGYRPDWGFSGTETDWPSSHSRDKINWRGI